MVAPSVSALLLRDERAARVVLQPPLALRSAAHLALHLSKQFDCLESESEPEASVWHSYL